MKAKELLERLAGLGVSVEARGERLRFRPAERVPAELQAEMAALKGELLGLLQLEAGEIGWRVAAMREQMSHHRGDYLPMLVARKGLCFSCGEPSQQGAYMCDFCRRAKHIVLGL